MHITHAYTPTPRVPALEDVAEHGIALRFIPASLAATTLRQLQAPTPSEGDRL
ncbi:hypothetical protein [Actinomadura montaniterrae]|uniref:hypothetical protein n=1 Tax=Actinomadura montaniterrae TaxID=1803903 RepID=UPI00178C3F4D|nr:hypothetical protein [Actinomadura montaniterrae]